MNHQTTPVWLPVVAAAAVAAAPTVLGQTRAGPGKPTVRLVRETDPVACGQWRAVTWEACRSMPGCDAARVNRAAIEPLAAALDSAMDAYVERACEKGDCGPGRTRTGTSQFACRRGNQLCLTRAVEVACDRAAEAPRRTSPSQPPAPRRTTPTPQPTPPAPQRVPAEPAAPTGQPAVGQTPQRVPGPPPTRTASLSRVYQGDDGGALYLRRVGETVFGFAEQPGQGYAFVLSGEVSGDRIHVQWWDVPKQGRTGRGSTELQWSQSWARLVRKSGEDFGPDEFTSVAPSSIPWAGPREAGFQSVNDRDLDGVFLGDDGSSHYVREINDRVVWVAEAAVSPAGTQPSWVTVFIGTRAANGGISGDYADVPKGRQAVADGRFGAASIAGTRTTSLSQPGLERTSRLEPEYAVEFTAFADSLRAALDGKVTGYAYAIAQRANIVREGAGGVRRAAQDGGALPFTVDTQNGVASASKLVTAAVVLRTLEEKQIPLDTTVARYLPSCWPKGPGIHDLSTGLTIRQLLAHRSRITRPSSCGTDDRYACLRDSIAAGRDPNADVYDYQNINYTLFRYILPRIRNDAVDDVFCTADGRERAHHGSSGAAVNQNVSERFARHVLDQVLRPLGLDTGFEWTAPRFTLYYDFSRPGAPGLRANTSDAYLGAGSGGMKWSAREYTTFLVLLDAGRIVSPAMLRTMQTESLGFDATSTGEPRRYPTKNGGTPPPGVSAQAIMLPGHVNAFVTINSSGNAYTQSLATILATAYENAIK
jgi:CubicO group peptidase (beta-lactamase class C family)